MTCIFEDQFDGNLDKWIGEGPPGTIVKVADGSLLIDTRDACDRPLVDLEGLNLWCKTPLSGDWRMSYDLEPIAPVPGDGDRCNLLFMFNCNYQDPKLNLLDYSWKRNGSYQWLHGNPKSHDHYEKLWDTTIPLMHGHTITYYRMSPAEAVPYQIVVRKNPGFHLVKDLKQTIDDQWNYRHQIHIEKRGNDYRFFQNNIESIAFTENSEFGSAISQGYWGFRTWRAAVRLYSVKVEAL